MALENGSNSIAFPGISTGVYGYPIDEAAKVSLDAINKWIDNHPAADINVYLCCFRDREMAAYEAIINK